VKGRASEPTVRDEGGFTLVELLVAMVLMVIVAGVAFSGLNSVVTTSRRVEDRGFAVTDARQAVELIIRDARAANPIDLVAPVALYDTKITFSVYCADEGVDACSAENLEQITYQVTGNALTRSSGGVPTLRLGPDAAAGGLPVTMRQGAILNTATEPVFTYFDAAGDALQTQGAGAVPSTTIQNCARSVAFHLLVRSSSGEENAVVDLGTTVDLRNYNEVSQCVP